MTTRKVKQVRALLAMLVVMVTLSSCSGLSAIGEEITRAFKGVPATMQTFNEDGIMLDEVHGSSFRVSRDERFDTSNSDGTSKNDSSVLLISLGDSHLSHVGSTMIMAQDGLIEVTESMPETLRLTNYDPGAPWLNDLVEKHGNLWKGKSKTLMIRSQNGSPIAVYAGENVEMFPTDIPKSTWFRVDGHYLLVYRADYTLYDNDLLS